MATKSVRIDEDLYERIEAHKREDETFSEAIERLIGGYSLLDFADEFAGETDNDRWPDHEKAIEAAEEAQREEMRELHGEQ